MSFRIGELTYAWVSDIVSRSYWWKLHEGEDFPRDFQWIKKCDVNQRLFVSVEKNISSTSWWIHSKYPLRNYLKSYNKMIANLRSWPTLCFPRKLDSSRVDLAVAVYI